MARFQALFPIAMVLFGIAFLSLMDAFMKSAALVAGTFTATWLRALMGTAVAAPLWLARGGRWPARSVMKLHLERGLVSTFMALTFFFALTKLPIAEAIAISFMAPLVALYLARLLLGETIRREAVFASLLGIAGTLVIVGGKIGQGDFDSEVAIGIASILFSAMLYAYNFIVIRRQSQVAGPIEIAMFHSAVAAVILGIAAPFLFVVPQSEAVFDAGMAALLTVAGAMAIAWAYARAEAQNLVPLEYSGFVWASLFGWLFFRETVTTPTLVGTGLIVIGCWLAGRPPRSPRRAVTSA